MAGPGEVVGRGDADDAAAEEALKAAAPFPKLPDLGAASYRLAGAIVYRLSN